MTVHARTPFAHAAERFRNRLDTVQETRRRAKEEREAAISDVLPFIQSEGERLFGTVSALAEAVAARLEIKYDTARNKIYDGQSENVIRCALELIEERKAEAAAA